MADRQRASTQSQLEDLRASVQEVRVQIPPAAVNFLPGLPSTLSAGSL